MVPSKAIRKARAILSQDLSGLPDALIQVGTADLIETEGRALAQCFQQAGNNGVLEVWQDMPHNWHAFRSIFSEADAAIKRIAEFIAARL